MAQDQLLCRGTVGNGNDLAPVAAFVTVCNSRRPSKRACYTVAAVTFGGSA